jgi:UDP-N-acetylmuramoylalanine--D-glutamate ligase
MSKRIVILGSGESGAGAAVLAKIKGFDVFVSDMGKIKDNYKELLNKHSIPFEEGKHTAELILNADEIIKSPGIPEKADMVIAVRTANIPVISEIEFAGRYTSAYKVCITGSNGKTTTTSLIYHMMKKAGLNVGLAGNIGKSFALQVATENFDYYVLEISNFQLDDMFEFKADIAILLNITPDHLDRYDYDLQKYIDSKFRITRNLTEEDFFIYCSDDDLTIREMEKIVTRARQLTFTLGETPVKGAYLRNNSFQIEFDDVDFSMSLDELSLKGKHNTYNSMAAGITGSALKIRNEIIRESLVDFVGVEHRLEPVTKRNGIEYINDSKATNVNSAWYALECMASPVVWIAGGTDKGNDYSSLNDLVKKKVKALVCLGKDNSKLHKAFDGLIPTIIDTNSMQQAIKTASHLAKEGDVVLLSPACASFDLFDNYEDRGRQFKKYAKEL